MNKRQAQLQKRKKIEAAKKRKRKSAKRFRKGLLLYLSILSVLIIISLVYVFIALAKYQKNVDEEAASAAYIASIQEAPQKYFSSLVDTLTLSDWTRFWYDSHPDHFDSEDNVEAFLTEKILNKSFTYWKAYDYSVPSPSYLIRDDDGQDIATFYLNGQDLNWTLDHVTFLIQGSSTTIATVPAGCTVYCNGSVVNDSYKSAAEFDLSLDGYENELSGLVNYETVTIDEMISEGTISLESNSSQYEISSDDNGDYYFTLPEAQSPTYQSQAESFIRSLLNYYNCGKTNPDENMNAALSHVASGSNAAKVIRSSYDGIIWATPKNIAYSISSSKTYVLAENCYFVDVTFIDTNADSTSENNGTYRVYMLNLGSGFKIYTFALQ